MEKIQKQIDLKSFIIGFLLALVIFLFVGAANSGIQEVKIVDIAPYCTTLDVKITNEPIDVNVK